MASSYAGEGPGIKAESNTLSVNETELHIKSDPDSKGVSPAALSDEDIYEEDPGDLDFSGAAEGVYLTRIPKFLWENWAKLAEDQEIQLGTVRIEGTPGDVKRVCHHPVAFQCHLNVRLLRSLPADESHAST